MQSSNSTPTIVARYRSSHFPAVLPYLRVTAEMLQACGNAVSISVDPEGKDIFFQVLEDRFLCYSGCIFHIAKLPLKNMEIVPTGYSIPLTASLRFGPDDALIYAGGQINTQTLAIYVFDPKQEESDRGAKFMARNRVLA